MAIEFLQSRGCVIQVNKTGTGRSYDLKGFPSGGENSPILLTEAIVTRKDLVLPVTTLSNKKVLYTFGEDFGSISLNGIIFLGRVGESTDGITKVLDWYNSNSVGNKTTPAATKLSLPGKKALSIYVIGITLNQPNHQNNYIPFTITATEA